MKRLSLILGILVALVFTTAGNSTFAQSESTSTKNELKEEQKIQKAKVKLEKSKLKLSKTKDKYNSRLSKFERDNSAGRLSPNDISKITKKLEKQRKAIENLQKQIVKLESFLKESGETF